MKSRLSRVLITLLSLVLAGPAAASSKAHLVSELYRSDAYAPYTWQHGPRGQLALEDLHDSHHPLKEVGELFHLIRDGGTITDEATRFADALVAKYNLDRPNPVMKYPAPAKNLPAGWHTAMAQFLLSMILLDMGDALERQDLTRAGVNLFESTRRDMTEGGAVIRDIEGCHLVEYADGRVPAEENVTVHNGMLHSLISVFHLQSRAAVAEEAKELYRCARTKAEVIGRAANGSPYPYYQLNPKEVVPVYYLIFEVLEYRTLFQLTGDPFFKAQGDYRENLLRQAYPLEYRHTESGYEYLLSFVSFPHPYALDTFYATLSCVGADSATRYSVNNRAAKDAHDLLGKAFLRIKSPERLKHCTLNSNYDRNSVDLFTTEGHEVTQANAETLDISIRPSFDARLEGKSVAIDPSILDDESLYKDMALIDIDVKQPVHLRLSELLYVRICTSKTPFQINDLRIANADGATIRRYWPSIEGAGCKLVPLSPVGFHDYESGDFANISTVSFVLGTADKKAYSIESIEVGVLRTGFQKWDLMSAQGNDFDMTP